MVSLVFLDRYRCGTSLPGASEPRDARLRSPRRIAPRPRTVPGHFPEGIVCLHTGLRQRRQQCAIAGAERLYRLYQAMP